MTSVISAWGPPVDEPINSTLGVWVENGRRASAPDDGACTAGAGAAGRATTGARAAAGAGPAGANGGLATAGFLRRRAPR